MQPPIVYDKIVTKIGKSWVGSEMYDNFSAWQTVVCFKASLENNFKHPQFWHTWKEN